MLNITLLKHTEEGGQELIFEKPLSGEGLSMVEMTSPLA